VSVSRAVRVAGPSLLLGTALVACTPVPKCQELEEPGVAEGAAGYALRFCGTGADDVDRVKIRIDDPDTDEPGPPVDVGATDFTIEFWMRAIRGENPARRVDCGPNAAWTYGNIVIDRDRYSQDREYGISLAGGRVVFGVRGAPEDPLTICGSTRVDDSAWHHVAVTRARADGSLRLFVDGRIDASAPRGPLGDISYPDDGVPGDFCGGPCVNSDPYLVFGAEKHDAGPNYPAFSGWLDEVRISTVIRYDAPFSPPERPFEPDALTVGLWHFDEGSGDTTADDSSVGSGAGQVRFGGPYRAPHWVVSGAPLR